MEVNLVQEKRQGLGKPNLIYVGKIEHEETENLRFLSRKNYDSGIENITNLESENLRGINTNNIKTNIINTDSINPNSDDEFYLKEIKDKQIINFEIYVAHINHMIREEAIDVAVQEIISAIEIPSNIIRMLKDKIMNCLNELYFVENRLVSSRSKRLQELEHLINKSYEDKLLGKLPASFTDDMFNKQYEAWTKERDLIAIEINESNNINRTIYKNIDLIIDFCNRIPELYINSNLDNKRIMLRMLIEEILYNYIDTTLEVKLKPIFEALRRIKESYDDNVRTRENTIIKRRIDL